MITDYIIVEGFDKDDLRIKVLNAIKTGYKPQGGVHRISEIGEVSFYQAMIKEED